MFNKDSIYIAQAIMDEVLDNIDALIEVQGACYDAPKSAIVNAFSLGRDSAAYPLTRGDDRVDEEYVSRPATDLSVTPANPCKMDNCQTTPLETIKKRIVDPGRLSP